jgi:DNA-binding LacI/PurR family transcriptional regulator
LQARGIHGGLVRSFPLPIEEVHIPFDRFIGIDLFSDPHLKRLPTVSSFHAQSMEMVLDELVKRGYRHPALILAEDLSKYLRHGWWMAFTANAHRFSETSTFFRGKKPVSKKQQDQWLKKKGVDALVYCTSENFIPKDALGNRGMGIVCMDLLDPECGISGISQNRKLAGSIAVEWLHGMLINAQIGWERTPHAVLIPGTWQPGKTLKKAGE